MQVKFHQLKLPLQKVEKNLLKFVSKERHSVSHIVRHIDSDRENTFINQFRRTDHPCDINLTALISISGVS